MQDTTTDEKIPAYTAGEIIDLDENQQIAVTSEASRLCIIAAAGSGKTRVIVKRIEHICTQNSALPDQIIAITFTRKAGFELASRLAKIFPTVIRQRPFVGTLHSFVMSELITHHEEHNSHMRKILENPSSLTKELNISHPQNFIRAISWCKTHMINPSTIDEDTFSIMCRYSHISPRALNHTTFLDGSKKYIATCTKRQLMDHDDVLYEYLTLLKDPQYRATRHYLYRHLFVDEFQDTTPLHMEIYLHLVGETGSLSVVGDPDQSIFSFTGASPQYLENFSDYFPGAHIVFLSTNYRSTRANVDVARSVIIGSAHDKIHAPRSSNILPKLHVFSDEQSEADGVMQIVSTAHARGRTLSSIAILVRTNAQKDLFIQSAKKLGIPINIGRTKIDDPVIADILSTIRSLRHKRRWRSIYDALDDITNIHDQHSSSDTLNEEESDVARRKEIFSTIRRSARQYMDLFSYDRLGDVTGFFEYLQSQLTPHTADAKGVSILTFHQSKGLEFSTVIVSGCEKGLVPLYNDKIRKSEESRLTYVALSRATDELHVTRAKVRIRNGKICVQEPSEFLKVIKENIADLDIRKDTFGAQDAIERIADIRAKHLTKKSSVKS